MLLSCHLQNILDLWLPAWPLIVQPAIGILMAGAVPPPPPPEFSLHRI